jgi:hypothetical protein
MVEMPRDEGSVEGAAETKNQYHKPTFRAFGTVRELTQTSATTDGILDYAADGDYATSGYE